MSLESVKLLFEKAGIQPASNEIPGRPHGLIDPSPESYVLHDMSLRHVRIVLDPNCRPTQNNGLWYDGHFGMKGGASSMLMTEELLLRHREQIARFAHQEIAAFNIAQIETGLAVIGYLKERTRAQEDPAIAVTTREDFRNGARVIVLTDAAALPPVQSKNTLNSEQRLAL